MIELIPNVKTAVTNNERKGKMKFNELDEVINEIKTRDNFIVTSHLNPEGDSMGSQLALYEILNKCGKKVAALNQDGCPENLKFLQNSDIVYKELPYGFLPETAIVLDCPVRYRVGAIAKVLDKADFVINVDHHVSNEFFGDLNWIEPDASSVGEMVYHIGKKLNVEMDKTIAEAIYVAIVTDTGMFNYENTSRATHEIAGELMSRGVKPNVVFRHIFENKSYAQLRVLARVLSDIKLEEDGKLAYVSLTRDMIEGEGLKEVAHEEFINYPRAIKGVEVAVLFNQKDPSNETLNVSFRSNGKIDVNKIASSLGGGGHKKASGCLMRMRPDDARKKVLETVKAFIRETK